MTRDELPPRQRENEDPDEQVRPIPRLLIAMLVIGVSWGAFYLARTSTDVRPARRVAMPPICVWLNTAYETRTPSASATTTGFTGILSSP